MGHSELGGTLEEEHIGQLLMGSLYPQYTIQDCSLQATNKLKFLETEMDDGER